MSQDPHATALLGLLQAHPHLAGRVHDGAVPDNTTPPYVLVYLNRLDNGAEDLTHGTARAVVRAYCHCVGSNADAARIVAGNVREALLDVVPTVAGRTCYPIRNEATNPPQRDESTGAVVLDQVAVYRLESVPA